jgi:ketosteroid isomerase-like protein
MPYQAPLSSQADEAAIRNIFVNVLPSMVKARNIQGYAGLFAEDAVWCPPNAIDRTGPAQIAVGVSEVLANDNFDPTFYADDVQATPEFGYVFGRSKELITPIGGGQTTTAYSRELWVFRKISGEWKIYRMIWNLRPALE